MENKFTGNAARTLLQLREEKNRYQETLKKTNTNFWELKEIQERIKVLELSLTEEDLLRYDILS